jgi:3-deoxy-manno-octulosonate cytidylyltransferase (CMP-KDO synthetase)
LKILGIIPSRYGSTRFPGKPLIEISGKSMVQRTYEQVRKSGLFEKVIVATDDKRIFDHVIEFGGEAMMTSESHQSGTDRCGEVVEKLGENFDYVINVQGDEPFILKQQLEDLVETLKNGPEIATLIRKIDDISYLDNPNKPKVVIDLQGNALLFSRSKIPFQRNSHIEYDYFHHIGVYAFKPKVLKDIVKLEQSPLEKIELLEQLRWMENGYKIKTAITNSESIGIDTPEDLLKLKENGKI